MKKIELLVIGVAVLLSIISCQNKHKTEDEIIYAKVDSLIKLMTIEEKVGQLNHLTSNYSTDVYGRGNRLDSEIIAGRVGSITPSSSIDTLTRIQRLAVEKTRLHIPLLYATDVIHGYRTIFPVPLAQACSWDLAAIGNSEHIAAIEAASAGINWTFAPMVDISRDPRWGRVMEGAGEDPYLGSCIARARVRGFQGDSLGDGKSIMACVKHFAAYGAPEGGREYNTVDMSERVLREVMSYKAEPGDFKVFVGGSSVGGLESVFKLKRSKANQLMKMV
jgi:beta-glucosidase